VGLREYRRKRDFSVTPEPPGREAPGGSGRSFVVQKHAASRLHYDFRLELEGVLKSWAVPKGPSLDPADKRLAMQTEDHPVEYGDFEGIIPEGEYGGGTVVVWDQGTWEPVGNPHQDFHKGSMKFRLHGHKLRGGFALVRIASRDARDEGKSWLLIKEKDDQARPGYDLTAAEPQSVVSGRSLEQVKADRDRVWHSNREAVVEADVATSAAREARWPATEPRKAAQAKTTRSAKRSSAPARSVARAGVAARATAAAAAPRRAALDASTLPGARGAPLPESVEPQLATLVARAPEGDGWLHEMKIDGYRILARLQNGRAQLLSRHGNDWTARLPEVKAAVETLPAGQALLDGEAAVLREDGTTSFQALQNWMGEGAREGRLVYYVFDLLHLDGYDVRAAPLEARKELLARLMAETGSDRDQPGVLRLSEHVVGNGAEFQAQACRLGLEGVVSKRRDEAYHAGRGRDWVKAKCVHEQEFVIAGFTPPKGARVGIGALLVGVYDATGKLRYAGKVGTGFSAATLRALEARLRRIEQKTSPFVDRVSGAAGARWVKPQLVGEVAFTEWTSDGKLRHPTFRGLREDKPAREVVRETPSGGEERDQQASVEAVAARPQREPAKRPRRSGVPEKPSPGYRRGENTVEIAGIRLTHAERLLYPQPGISKRGLAEYYVAIADFILPQLAGRPTTLVRCPEGQQGDCFFQKHVGFWAPQELRRVKIQEATKVGEYLVVDDLPGLIGLVQLGILEIHTWNAMADRLEQPDRLVFDLDPDPAVPWDRVVAAARRVRGRLHELDLESFVKTTGGKGLHVVVPLQRGVGWEESARFAEDVSRGIARAQPELYIAEMSKAKRRGRVFIDWLRNHRGATSICAYSTRAKPSAPVATPLAWEELDALASADAFTVGSLPARLAALQAEPWAGYSSTRQRLTASRLKAAAGR
jgi:bifunctional non-homologous end joining protein LigD